MQPPAVTAGLVAAVHPRFSVRPRRRLGDAVGHLLGMTGLDAVVAHAASLVADADVPALVAELQAHVQINRLGRKLAPWGCSGRRHFHAPCKEWKAVLTRRRADLSVPHSIFGATQARQLLRPSRYTTGSALIDPLLTVTLARLSDRSAAVAA